jgi:hypothetical protein
MFFFLGLLLCCFLACLFDASTGAERQSPEQEKKKLVKKNFFALNLVL